MTRRPLPPACAPCRLGRYATVLALIFPLIGCGKAPQTQPAPPAPPSPYPIDFPLAEKWSWRGAGRIVGRVIGDAARLYVSTATGGVYAVNRSDGKTAWMFKALKPIPTAPLLYGDRLIVYSNDDEYYELKASTGEVAHKETRFGRPVTTGAIAGDSLYFASNENQLRRWSLKEHRLVWRFVADGKVVCEPRVADNRVYFGTLDGVLYCIDADSQALAWKVALGGEIRGRPAVLRNLVIVGSTDNIITAVDRAKGQVKWRMRTDADLVSPPVVINVKDHDRILIAGFDNYLHCYEPDGNLRFSVPIPARMYDELLVHEHMIIAAPFAKKIAAIDPETGNQIATADLPSESRATPLLLDRTLYLCLYDQETGEGLIGAYVYQPPPPPQTQPSTAAPQSQPAAPAPATPAAQTQPKPPATQTQPKPPAK